MKKNKIVFTCIALVVLIIVGVIVILKTNNNNNNEENNTFDEKYNEILIDEIKNEINATADDNIYQIDEEYDGRKILQIKPNIQFETVLAGILKKDSPNINEINNLIKNRPNKSGIWVSEKSREEFATLLKINDVKNFIIDEEGYVNITSKDENTPNEEQFQKKMQTENLNIIDISGRCFVRDEITGDIVEYPFEKMDPYQALEIYDNENERIIEITTNEKQKLTSQDIFENILQCIK